MAPLKQSPYWGTPPTGGPMNSPGQNPKGKKSSPPSPTETTFLSPFFIFPNPLLSFFYLFPKPSNAFWTSINCLLKVFVIFRKTSCLKNQETQDLPKPKMLFNIPNSKGRVIFSTMFRYPMPLFKKHSATFFSNLLLIVSKTPFYPVCPLAA